MPGQVIKPQTIGTAPKGARQALRDIRKRAGFIPNLIAILANSPAVLSGYLALDGAWNRSSFSFEERQIILLTASVENKCSYCIAAHATALKAMRVDRAIIGAIRDRAPLADRQMNALVVITREIVSGRGLVPEIAKRDFLDAGYGPVALLEVVVGVALATIGNYLDHLNPISVDHAFQAEAQL